MLECDGEEKPNCKFYGDNGTVGRPTEDDLQRAMRKEKWGACALQLNCAYYPCVAIKKHGLWWHQESKRSVYHGTNAVADPPSETAKRQRDEQRYEGRKRKSK